MRPECSIVRDLLPLYVEDLVSTETANYIAEHLGGCPKCQAELADLKKGAGVPKIEPKPSKKSAEAKPFQKAMKRVNRHFYTLVYSLIIFFIFLGFGWTGGENLMYNSLIMPIVGVFGYSVFRWKAVYKVPILLLIIDLFVYLFKWVALDLFSTLMWTVIYSLFVLIGIAIAFLLHYATRKEKIE